MKVDVADCVTCMMPDHEGIQFPRPTCVQFQLPVCWDRKEQKYNDDWVQVCEPCWNKLDKKVRDAFKQNHEDWAAFGKALEKRRKKRGKKA